MSEELNDVKFEKLIESPKKKKGPEYQSNEYSFWRYLLFLVLGFGGGQMIAGALAGTIVMLTPLFFEGGIYNGIKDGATILIAFALNYVFARLLIKPILHTSFKSLVTGNRKYKVKYGFVCIVIYIIVMSVALFISRDKVYFAPAEINVRIACLIFVLLLVPLQTTTEETFFRMSLGRLFMKNQVFKSVPKMLLVSVISGLIFFVPHLTNPEVRAYGMLVAVVSYFGAGFALMLMSCIVGSFEGALAVHAINNIWSMSIVSLEVSAATFNPFFIDTSNNQLLICGSFTVLYGLLIVWSIIYRKKHKLAET